MSITAAITGALVLSVRAIRTIPRRIAVFFWLIPFFRMTVPLGFSNPYSLMSLLSGIAMKTVVVFQPTDDLTLSMMNSVMAADSYFPITYKVNVLERVFGTASAVWIIVFSAIFLLLAVTYFTTLREIRDAAHLRDNIYFSDKITSPAVYGIIKPKIVLPVSYMDKDIELILLHEETHIRHADNLWRYIAFFITAVHWFNPLCWVFLKFFLADLELSCDECVLLKVGDSRANEYALTLLKSGQSAPVFASAFGGAKIRVRIENILSFKKMTWFSLTVFVLFIAAVFCVLLTNA